MRPGIFFVVSAPSGTGKTTLCNRVLASFENLRFSISTTTRPPRPNEQDGREYHFVSVPEFEKMIERGKFAEHANVYGNWYGTSNEELTGSRERGEDLLIEIDVQGARSLKKAFPDTVLIFVHPPSLADLEARLRARGTDTEEVIRRRLAIAGRELAEMGWYDYLVGNVDLDRAVDDLTSVIRAERLRLDRTLPALRVRFPGIL